MTRTRRNLALAAGATIAMAGCDAGSSASTSGGSAPSVVAGAVGAPGEAAATRAVITIDAAHDVMTRKDAPAYAIAPSTSLVIEVGDHAFTPRDAAGNGPPDAVHVVHGSTGYYRASFSGKRVTLGPASLDTVKGREAFPGFEAGESYLVAVGSEAPSASDGAMRFAPVWTARVSVAPR